MLLKYQYGKQAPVSYAPQNPKKKLQRMHIQKYLELELTHMRGTLYKDMLTQKILQVRFLYDSNKNVTTHKHVVTANALKCFAAQQ